MGAGLREFMCDILTVTDFLDAETDKQILRTSNESLLGNSNRG